MILQDYINNGLKLENFNLVNAVYDEKIKKLVLKFVCPNDLTLTPEFIKDFEEKISKFLSVDGVDIEINIKNVLIDETQIKIVINKYFEDNYPFVASLIKLDNLNLKEGNGYYTIDLTLDKTILSTINIDSLKNDLSKILSNQFLAKFNIDVIVNESDLKLNQIIKDNDNFSQELAMLRESNKPQFLTYEFFQSNSLIGEICEKEAVRIDCLKEFNGLIVLAGTVGNVVISSYTPKVKKEGESSQEKIRLNFTLRDYWGEINCVYFPNQKTQELIKDIVDGMTIAVQGEISEFGGRFNFKIKALSHIILPEKVEEEDQHREPFKDYLVVKPMQYEENVQMNLLDNQVLNLPQYIMDNDFVVYDFETTGLSPEMCQVIEIGAVKVHNGKITEIFSTLIKSKEPLPEEIIKITNITDDMLVDAPCFELAFADFYKFCQGCILVGYNNLDFDTKFLKKAWKQIGFAFDFKEEDAFLMAKKKLRLPNYKLGTVVKALDVELINAHRAYADATATAKVFLKLVD